MTCDIMPYLIAMRKLDRYNVVSTFDRWAEEVQAMLALSGTAVALKNGGKDATPADDEAARAVILLSLERDMRDWLQANKYTAGTASDLWGSIRQARKRLDEEDKAAAAKAGMSPRSKLAQDYNNLSVASSSGSGWN